ncbi:MAG: hypothetical protein IJU44_12630 [Kiritimatiellae bacterium]|nr:hypothetical protein [Kiritimatiellia bacterium]
MKKLRIMATLAVFAAILLAFANKALAEAEYDIQFESGGSTYWMTNQSFPFEISFDEFGFNILPSLITDHLVVNSEGVTVTVVETSDVAGATVTRTQDIDPTGRTTFVKDATATSRFYRLSAAVAE